MSLPLLGVMHVNVNCSDLERSLAFYRDLLGLMPLSRTKPLPQDGEGFGLPGRVQWDAHLLHDHRGLAAPAVDLLEWQTPRPVGSPPEQANQLGFARLCLRTPDLAAAHERMRGAGVGVVGAPATVPIDPAAGLSVSFMCVRDPDGTLVELLEQPGPSQLLHVNVNCSDVSRSGDWYERVLGLETIGRSRPGPVEGAPFGFDGTCEWDARFLAVPAQADRFVIDLLQWLEPEPVGTPAIQANRLGMFRMAFLVEDARACTDSLRADGVDCTGPVWLEMGPDIPIDGLWATFFRDPDGVCLELIQQPVRRA